MKRFLCAALGAAFLLPVQAHAYDARMYGLRGLLGGALAFSRGVDTALEKAKAHNVRTYIKPWYRWREFAATAKANYRIDGLPVILIGHSLGADAVSWIAEDLRAAGIPVAAAFYYDPTRNVRCVPNNVQVALGWRRTAMLNLGGGRIAPCPGFAGDIERFDVHTTHTHLDDAQAVHAETVKRVGDVVHMIGEMKGPSR